MDLPLPATTAAATGHRDDDEARVPAFSTKEWRTSAASVAAAGCVLAFAAALWYPPVGVPGGRWWSILLVAEAAALLLPWGQPSDRRGGVSFWLETLAGLITPVGAVLVAVWHGGGWMTTGAAWQWYAVGAAFGYGLIRQSGLKLRTVVRGELAFLMGPTRRTHATARATSALAGPMGEEVLFRGLPVLTAPVAALPALSLLAAVAFVARHHIAPSRWRGGARSMIVELVAAGGLLALTVASHSIYPALLAHLINNLPMAVLDIQRGAIREEES